MTTTILLAGASGDLGRRLARELLARSADVRALTRAGSRSTPPEGTTVVAVDYADAQAMRAACEGVDVVVSTLAGLRDVVVDAQTQLLDAAVAAGVPRFVPSDWSADFRRLPAGTNRNLGLRREFAARLDAAPIRATSVLNSAFADMLTGQPPLVLVDRSGSSSGHRRPAAGRHSKTTTPRWTTTHLAGCRSPGTPSPPAAWPTPGRS